MYDKPKFSYVIMLEKHNAFRPAFTAGRKCFSW